MIESTAASRQGEKTWHESWHSLANTCGLNYRPGWTSDPYLVGAALAAMGYWIVLAVVGIAGSPNGAAVDLMVVLSVVLWQPVLEELFFRGVLQGLLLEATGGCLFYGSLTVANVATSLVFASAHLPAHQLLWVAGIGVVSLVLGYLRERLGSLYPSVLLHSYYNGGYLLMMGWASQ
ncbi:MAG: JDVT-CTERM system glutamic-type intramembrane protease [Nitrospiraceae bacterium]